MKKFCLIILILIASNFVFAQETTFKQLTKEESKELNKSISGGLNILAAPVNDACVNATNLTIGANCIAGTTDQSTISSDPTGGCGSGSVAGCGNPGSVWYSFNSGTNTSLNLNIDITDFGNCANWQFAVYGPFNSVAAGCTPTNASAILCSVNELLQSNNQLMTGLTTNKVYLVQITQFGANGGSYDGMEFCINISQPLSNDQISGATNINSCGTSYTGSTANANATGCLTNNNDLDCDGTTDVGFSIENDSWFKFCAINAGTWNVTLGSVSACSLPSGNGLQYAVFTGTPTALTLQYSSNGTGNGIGNGATPASQTSSTFSVAAGGCAYMVVDGFAGNECSYSFTLTNVTGGCVVLPIELLFFTGENYGDYNLLKWLTASEINNDFFTLERSDNGVVFEVVGYVDGAGNSTVNQNYSLKDSNPYDGITYYRLRQTDFNGNNELSNLIAVSRNNIGKDFKVIRITNVLGQEVSEDSEGVKIYYFSNGTVLKKYDMKER